MKRVLTVFVWIFMLTCTIYGEDVNIKPQVELYFTGKDDCTKILADKIGKAKKTIYFCTYSLTDPYIAAALAKARKRGVTVSGVTEKQNAGGKGAKFAELKSAGVDIYLDDNSALMHHKFIIIDGYIVGTGSFNWTKNANEKNNENLIFLEGEDIADRFYKEYKLVYWKAKTKRK